MTNRVISKGGPSSQVSNLLPAKDENSLSSNKDNTYNGLKHIKHIYIQERS